MRLFFMITLLFLNVLPGIAQEEKKIIKVHFLYGSKPAKNYRHIEKNWFGGIKGGHVSIEIDQDVIGFEPLGKFHVFANDKQRHSYYAVMPLQSWAKDTASKKYVTIILPITTEQYTRLKQIHRSYIQHTPYDYAFFGYRCASSTYDILSMIDLLPSKRRHSTVIGYFYPKLLRSKMIQLAKERKYRLVFHEGRKTRIWEKDKVKDRRIIKELSRPHRKYKKKLRAA